MLTNKSRSDRMLKKIYSISPNDSASTGKRAAVHKISLKPKNDNSNIWNINRKTAVGQNIPAKAKNYINNATSTTDIFCLIPQSKKNIPAKAKNYINNATDIYCLAS